MAQIIINEFSDNYTFNVGNNAFATVALPITACWGPAVLDPATIPGGTAVTTSNGAEEFKKSVDLNKWERYPATPQGLDAFVSAYRGPSSTYKINKDYSYQMAVTLLTAGYDVLVYRMCSGGKAGGAYTIVPAGEGTTAKTFAITAKYAGSFGNNIKIQVIKKSYQTKVNQTVYTQPFWNMIVSVVGTSGNTTNVENLNFVITEPTAYDLPDYIVPIEDIQSNFVTVLNNGVADDTTYEPATPAILTLTGGRDEMTADATPANDVTKATIYSTVRYVDADGASATTYFTSISNLAPATIGATKLQSVLAMEFNYTAAYFAYKLLQDKLQYNPQRIIAPGWDDQNLIAVGATVPATGIADVSPLHKAIMLAAYYGRCGAGLLDIPLSCDQDIVKAYATKLSEEQAPNPLENNAPLYVTNSGLFAPWGQYRLAGMSKMVHVSPAFLALMISRAQILNQPTQYEWILPTNKKHNLNIKPDYDYTKTILDEWQDIEGVSLNVITNIPGQGIIVWGNSTLFNVPPVTYQALANLSTRYLMNVVENQAYIVSLGITFTYNNAQAISSYVVGCSPILDTMKNVGAIEDYKIVANPDINGDDYVNSQVLIGQIYMKVYGVVNDVVTDLYALPPTADLSQFGA